MFPVFLKTRKLVTHTQVTSRHQTQYRLIAQLDREYRRPGPQVQRLLTPQTAKRGQGLDWWAAQPEAASSAYYKSPIVPCLVPRASVACNSTNNVSHAALAS